MIHSRGSQRFTPHWHDAYTFGLLDRGAQQWRSRKGSVRGHAGQVINTNPGEVHDGRPDGGDRDWRMISMDVEAMQRLVGCSDEIAAPVIDDPELAARLGRLLGRAARWANVEKTDVLRMAIDEDLADACTLLMSRHGRRPFAPPRSEGDVDAVRDRLAEDFVSPPDLEEMAAMTGLSRYQVLRSFKRAYGLPPHAWLVSRRAERARALIRSGMALSIAAASAGFADQSHMTRTFVRLYGYTAGALQAATTPRTRDHAVPTPLKKV